MCGFGFFNMVLYGNKITCEDQLQLIDRICSNPHGESENVEIKIYFIPYDKHICNNPEQEALIYVYLQDVFNINAEGVLIVKNSNAGVRITTMSNITPSLEGIQDAVDSPLESGSVLSLKSLAGLVLVVYKNGSVQPVIVDSRSLTYSENGGLLSTRFRNSIKHIDINKILKYILKSIVIYLILYIFYICVFY